MSTLIWPLTRRFAPLLAVFIVEFFLFDQFGAKRFTSIYPRWNDQVQYLAESYSGYEYARSHGVGAGVWHTLTNQSQQGTLHDLFALIVFTAAGPSRSAALALNLLALIAWQATLFVAVARRTQSPPLAFAIALWPLLLAGAWQGIPGSAYDFRLDHLALCGLGIAATTAWLSDGFRSRFVSTLFGGAVGLTLLTRFLTGVYFALIFVALFAWLFRAPERAARLRNLSQAALVALVIAAPILWLNRESVYDYYWIGHYVGPESAIRNSHLGLGRSTAFVAGHLVQRHVGYFYIVVVAAGAAALAFTRKAPPAQTDRTDWMLGATFLLAPALALILHQQKSEVVVGALVPGLVLLGVVLWGRLATGAPRRLPGILATGTALTALAYYTHAQMVPIHPPDTVAQLRMVNTVADEIARRLRAAQSTDLRVAVDYVSDCFDALVLRVIIYERHRIWLSADIALPTGIVEPGEDVVMARLQRSDFVFLTEESVSPGLYPYDRKLAALRPQVRAWCEAHLRVANQFTFFGRRMVLYQRREIPFP